jgi:hypothetical protein
VAATSLCQSARAVSLDQFGVHIVLSRDGKVLIGLASGGAANAPGINRNHAPDRTVPPLGFGNTGGAVYVFELQDGAWTQRAAVIPPFTDVLALQDMGLVVTTMGTRFRASGAGRQCVYPTMNTLNICEPDEPKATCWLRQAVTALLGLAALLLLVASFAVEVMATGADLPRRAESSVSVTQAMSGLDIFDTIDQPLKPTN